METSAILLIILCIFVLFAIIGFIIGIIRYNKERKDDRLEVRSFNLNVFFNYWNLGALICLIVAIVILIFMVSTGNLNV